MAQPWGCLLEVKEGSLPNGRDSMARSAIADRARRAGDTCARFPNKKIDTDDNRLEPADASR